MARSQKIIVIILGLLVVAALGGLAYVIGQDVLTYDIAPLVSDLQAARVTPPPPTVILVWPTASPTIDIRSTSTADQAIAFVQNYKFSPDQEKTLAGLISTVQAASEQLGNNVSAQDWWAEDQQENHWIVAYSFWENSTPKTYKFSVNLDTHDIQGYNEAGITILTFLKQQAEAAKTEPTATPVAITLGWAMRDYFTNWEYSVPTAPQFLKAITGTEEILHNETGFLAIPLKLRNIGGAAAILNSEYYSRFGLRDSAGKTAGLVSDDGLLSPTRAYCRSRGLSEFTVQSLSVQKNYTLSTALVFRLLKDTQSPYSLEITVYEGNLPHRYAIKLETQ